LRQHYENPRYFEGEPEQGYVNYTDMQQALIPHFRRRIHHIAALIKPGRILDFGCAAGFFLDIARSQGWQICGVELSSSMAHMASQRLGITVATALDQLPDTNIDALTLWEVIEHLPRPLETLAALRARLRPGGLLMLSTPNTGHWQAQREHTNWISYRPPAHLLYLTRDTLRDVLQRAGFERVQVRGTQPHPPLPIWLRHRTDTLRLSLTNGQAKYWLASLYMWRAVRAFGIVWQRLAHRTADIATTLEATAFRSSQ
jgi:SAM-dependent methyltransferase